ncbi:cache domain-containing protein, partial [Immundisolibacter sp.]|uniref:cache domain-containing protein n=1 Tax=Immundisolibacter sp. TaxID=1934948 RepID=UPI003F50A47D
MAALLPLVGLGAYNAWAQFEDAKASARSDSLALARLLAARQERDIDAARRLLEGLARVPVLRAGNTPACSRLLAQMRGDPGMSPYQNLTVFAANGDNLCSAEPLSRPVNMAHLPAFRDAAQAGRFQVLGYVYGQIIRQYNFSVMTPVLDDAGQVVVLLHAALDLRWLARVASDSALPPGSSVALVDPTGKILLRFPDPNRWAGRMLPANLARHLEGVAVELLVVEPGLDGVERIHAGVPLIWNGQTGVWFTASIPAAAAYAQAQRTLVISVMGFVVALMVLVIAWFILERGFLSPVHELTDMTRRIAGGEIGVQANVRGSGEIGLLATEFNHMLNSRRAARQTLAD